MTDGLPDIDLTPDVMKPVGFEKWRRFTDADVQPIIDGAVVLPNLELISDALARQIAAGYYGRIISGRAKMRSGAFAPAALFFVSDSDGSGMVMTSGAAAKFAICQHKKVSTLPSGFDPRRGWHPGYCEKCGLDMSYDSGD